MNRDQIQMPAELDRRVKTALNETRLLILGVQVLLGFQFQGFFQDAFDCLAFISKALSLASLALFNLCTIILIAPSMQHRIVERGYSSGRLLQDAGGFATATLGILAPALGVSVYVVSEQHFGTPISAAVGSFVAAAALFFWYGLGLLIGISMTDGSEKQVNTPLATRIEQLLMEARIIIPGAQALLGFQLTVMLTTGFSTLQTSEKIVHAMALGSVALNVVLLMTPAALHRLSFSGHDSEKFLRIGSAFVIAAPMFLAAGIAGDIFVVFSKVLSSGSAGSAVGSVSFLMAIGFWYVLPLLLRRPSAYKNF